ncbi:type IV secretory system conjugative DNA transfer family protein [Ktedonobacter racemifer]|uniref:TRAG family protein n=1 Tax=Ktedonobacter racemifer DSM 44963 TaxID=485913 RepID=D6TSK5_KTERA|nr:type IV secretory system conjugative DNA transfer family protein [Ktedonobacter racemifer]EFH83406.1 TRAG family protein [Ktedonobacter racemifer DSM 44963]
MDTILQLGEGLDGSFWFIILIVLVFLALILLFEGVLRGNKTTDSYGSAKFAQLRDIKSLLSSKKDFEGSEKAEGEPAPSSLLLGRYKGKTIALNEETLENHVLMVAPTGAGKTSRVILPGLLMEEGHRSLFVIDPKQELVKKSAGYIAKHHEVWIFAPNDAARSHSYNPLAYITNLDDARDFAMSWIQNTGESKEPFWDRAAELLITATVLHLRTCEPDAPFSRLADIFSMPFEDLKALLTRSDNQTTRKITTSFLSNMEKNGKLIGSVMTDIANRFFMLFSPEVQAATAENDIDFNAMCDRSIALYLSIPFGDAERLRPLSATLIMQMMRTWIRRADHSPNGQLPRAIGCYLDEFANAGRIPHFESYISTLRSKRVALLMAIQAFSQLEDVYDPAGKETIISNSRTKLLLPGAGLEECEYFSKLTGQTTAVTKSQSKSIHGFSIYAILFADSQSFNKAETKRDLMTPDEMRTMREGSILMISGSFPVVLMQSIPYYQNQVLVERSQIHFQLPERATVIVAKEDVSSRQGRKRKRGRGGARSQDQTTVTVKEEVMVQSEDDAYIGHVEDIIYSQK